MKDISLFLSSLQERLDGLGEKGQGMVEYALILAAVAIIAVAAIWGTGNNGGTDLKTAVTGAFTKAATAVDNAQTDQSSSSGDQSSSSGG